MMITDFLINTALLRRRRHSYTYKTKEGSLVLVLGLAVLLVGLIISRIIEDEEKSKKVSTGFFYAASAVIVVSVIVDKYLAGK